MSMASSPSSTTSMSSSTDTLPPEMLVLNTFDVDGLYNFNVKPLLSIVEDILRQATLTGAQGGHVQGHDGVAEDENDDPKLKYVYFDIHKIGYKMLYEHDDNETMNEILYILSTYSWRTRPVLVLAAFAIAYGKFCLVTQTHKENRLARSIAVLKGIPDILSLPNDVLKYWVDNINNLIRVMLDMIHSILEYYDFPFEFITSKDSPLKSGDESIGRIGIDWVINGVVACAAHFNNLFALRHQQWDLSTLAFRIGKIHEDLRKQLIILQSRLDEKKRNQKRKLLEHLLSEKSTEVDNTEVLRILFPSKADTPPLFHASTNKMAEIDELRRKMVMLLITGMDITQGEITILSQVYQDAYDGKPDKPYEIVWLPIFNNPTEWTGGMQENFRAIRSSMPWYSVDNPSLIDPMVVQFIKEQWHFDNKPIIVVLNSQGRLVSQNAIHMIWIWGIMSFPFSRNREEDLWNQEKWNIEFLVDGINETILEWIANGKYICLYGGDDIDWIRKFTSKMQEVAREAQIPVEMIYVGTRKNKEQVRKNMATITRENLSYCWEDPMSVSFFWHRLESMWYSKTQHERTPEDAAMMRKILTMLTFDSSDKSNEWAAMGKGTGSLAVAPGWKVLDSLTRFDKWKGSNDPEVFVEEFIKSLEGIQSHEHCLKLVLPSVPGKQQQPFCAECGLPMETYVMYRCCDESADSNIA